MNDEVKNVWNMNAEFWDARMGEGNDFHRILIEPTQLKLLNIHSGQKILDVACGNGQFARKMAQLGAVVTAIDFSQKFLDIAKSKGTNRVNYELVDVTSERDLARFDGKAFDSVVCTMALMDIENIELLAKHLPRILGKNGIFVFSVLHPCFNSGETMLVHERDDAAGEVENKYSVKISNYLVEKSSLGIGMIGQPKPQYYFHRPISIILKYFFENGFALDACEEPSFDCLEKADGIFENVYTHVPPALVCRLRIADFAL